MSSKCFTPGPYVIEQTPRGVKIIQNRGASESYPICTVARNQQTTENAYLLAAAPEMFEALKSASIALDMVRGSTFCETCDDNEICETCGIYKALLQTDAVLKKARGKGND